MIYSLTAIGLSPGGSSTVNIYTQTIHRTIQNKEYIEQNNNLRTTIILIFKFLKRNELCCVN